MPTDLAVRLTYHDRNVTDLITPFNTDGKMKHMSRTNFLSFILSFCESIFVVCHNYNSTGEGSRQHVHMALKGCNITADAFRRKLKNEYSIRHDVPLESSDLSVKKWDGGDKYLIYMIKGQPEHIHPILHNLTRKPDFTTWLSEERIDNLRRAWKEGVCPQAENYKIWMAHESFPKKPALTWEQVGESNAPKLAFDDIVKQATKFICSIHGEWITAKHRHAIKDLVSNYCIRNGIKMSPIHI